MPLPRVWTAKVKASASSVDMQYGLENEFDKVHRCVIVVIDYDVPYARTFNSHLTLFEKIQSRVMDRFPAVEILVL